MQPCSDGNAAPLSFAQERLWFLDQYLAGSPIYHIPMAFRLQGPLQVDVLERAMTEIVARHEVLHTRFLSEDDGPRQVVDPVVPMGLPVRDIEHDTTLDPEDRVRVAIDQEVSQPLDLTKAPPLRASLLRVGPDDHVLVCQVHHIAFDGMSLQVFCADLAALYTAFAEGRESPLPPQSIQYRDYAVWQRRRLRGPLLSDLITYWQGVLGNGVPAMDLPNDRPLPRVPTYESGQADARFPTKLREGLRRLAEDRSTSVYTTVVAAFKVLLARHTGQEDVVVGVPVANRDRPEFKNLIGVFVNMLVSRSDLSGQPTFREVVDRVWDGLLDAYAHHQLPFEVLVEELHPERQASRTPFVDAVVNLLPTVPEMTFAELTCRQIEIPDRFSGYGMTLYLRDDGSGLSLVYQRERFDPNRMQDFLDQLVTLLEQAVALPDRDIYSYSLITHGARELLPSPEASLELPEYEPVTVTIERVAQRVPDQPAIGDRGRYWSYQEVVADFQSVARWLRTVGHQPGDVIGIAGPAGYDYVSCLLGVLAARCVVLPLDSSLPVDRQRLMLGAGNASRLIQIGTTPSGEWPCPVVHIRTDRSEVSAPGSDVELEPVHPSDPAHVYFTSGTSGTPKGILGVHNTLAHLITWERETFTTGTSDRCGLTTRLSFDMVLRDIFLPLTSGGTLCVPPDETLVLDAEAALRWLERERITLLHIVPTLAARWLEHVPAGVGLPDLRWVYFAGEPLTEELVGSWRAAFKPGGTAVNYYGTTETMVRTYHVLPEEPVPGMQSVGVALPHCQTIIVNKAWQQCGIGELGEVLLRSRICTRGYINAPEEQERRFLPNWFRADESDDICYRTGDVGRYLPDGTAEVLGRHDDQTKIHGVRIEPAEIQAAVTTHPDVAGAVVVKWEDQLVGYVVPRSGTVLEPAELRRFLRDRLPESMIPTCFTSLPALPMLTSGKVDKKALPPPDPVQDGSASRIPPRTETERVLATIWQDILRVPEVGLTDNFFDLGGHSLKVVDTVARIRKELGVDLPLRVLFEEPTLESLAVAVDQHDRGSPPDLDDLFGEADLQAIIATLEEFEEQER